LYPDDAAGRTGGILLRKSLNTSLLTLNLNIITTGIVQHLLGEESMTEPPRPPQPPVQQGAQGAPQAVLPSRELFRGQREVWIEHDGVRYRLRITRRNKLILQK
jgi:hemin uptake protein HemP